MATKNQLKIVVGKDSITLFGEKYFKSGKNWVVPALGMHVEVEPASDNLAEIIGCIEDDGKHRKTDQIDHLRINNRIASLAYLEGKISKDAFDHAEEKDDYIQISLEVLETTYPVRIYSEDSDVIIGTYDKNGKCV